jgi:hypothetical protein
MHIANGNIGHTLGTLTLAFVVTTALTACSWGAGTTAGAKTGGASERNREIVHVPCDVESSGAERIDANGDGKPDVTIVSEGGKERCRASDLDFDGRVDLYSYLDKAGKLERRELDYDRDGAIDEIQIFKDGVIVEKQRATTLAKRLDTWETYEQGRLVKAERDADGNGRIDQWWEYKSVDCPIIRTDTDGNGEPDPTSQVDFCSEAGYKPPEQATPTTAPVFQKDTQALPTETSNKAVTEPEDAGKKPETAEGAEKPGQPASSNKGQPNEK